MASVAADSGEPSMEEILASIRKIISEEPEAEPEKAPPAPAPVQAKRAPEPEPEPARDPFDDIEFGDEEEELELTEPAPVPGPDVLELTNSFEPVAEAAPEDPLVSAVTAEVASQSLQHLTGLMVRNYPGSENTLEGLVREMLKPMLKDWLDKHLPDMVEKMVQREIARISGRSVK
jgi:uncharacterized protein